MKHIANLVSVDPGKETGVSYFKLFKLDTFDERIDNTAVKTHKFISGYGVELLKTASVQFEYLTDTVFSILATVNREHHEVPLVVVCEDFVLTRTSIFGQAKWSLQGMGMVMAIQTLLGSKMSTAFDFSQKSTDAKNTVTNPRLTEMGLKQRGDKRTDHEMDAMRHAVLWVARLRNKEVALPVRS